MCAGREVWRLSSAAGSAAGIRFAFGGRIFGTRALRPAAAAAPFQWKHNSVGTG